MTLHVSQMITDECQLDTSDTTDNNEKEKF
jgi:hypothetical protein